MGRYRKILVAFDGSESSRNALRQAIRLAQAEKCWVKVVAVVPSYEGDLELVGVGNIEAAIKGPGEKLLAEAKAIAGSEGGSIITDLEQGEAYERIVDVASVENCDIIVMGRRGKARLERALMGGVTARVIGHTDRDVLVLPRNASVGWKNIILPTDGSRFSDAAVERAIDLAKSFGGGIHAVSVVDVNEEFQAEAPDAVSKLIQRAKALLESVKARAEAAGVKVDIAVIEGSPAESIAGMVEDRGADMVIMGSHGKTGLKRLLMGSVTEKVIGLVGCPVLVVRV
ncbi:MAG: universal stress protein [Nitrospirae bacterium]|nr:universal stress protein [Nitrospirota bacterium]